MMSLDQVALSCGTDKSSRSHNYTKYYSMFFNKFRYDPIHILEIGIWKGESLRMWKDFFENGNVYGVDYEDKSEYTEERIKTFIADQSVPEQLIDVMKQIPPIDIIVDDGGHRSPHMTLSLQVLFPLLKPGGLYCIEDCLTGYNPTFCKPNEVSIIERVKDLIGDVSMNGKIENLCSDKQKAKNLYKGSYFEENTEWVFYSSGLCILKKMK